MGKSEDDIVALVGPPGKSSKYSKGGADDGDMADDEGTESSDEKDTEAAELSAFQEYKDALQNGSDQEGLDAFKKLCDIVRM